MSLFWKKKKVLITGHEGFLGSNLAKRLLRDGACLFGLDVRVKRKRTNFTKEEYRRIHTIKGSIANYGLVKDIISSHKIQVVFHLAAEAIVGKAFNSPLRAFSSNIKGTWNVLEACRKVGQVEAIIVASSDKAYGSQKHLPYKEDSPLSGNHPYDVSKSCADLITYSYYHTYDVPVVTIRCGNIFGPGDFNFSRIIPDTIRCALLNKKLIIRSDGRFTRDYVYVEDIVRGYILAAEKTRVLKLAGQAFNLSNDRPVSVIELVNNIYEIAKKKPNYIIQNKARYEIKHQYLSSLKARRLLRWKPEYNLSAGLKEALAWYRQVLFK